MNYVPNFNSSELKFMETVTLVAENLMDPSPYHGGGKKIKTGRKTIKVCNRRNIQSELTRGWHLKKSVRKRGPESERATAESGGFTQTIRRLCILLTEEDEICMRPLNFRPHGFTIPPLWTCITPQTYCQVTSRTFYEHDRFIAYARVISVG